MVYDLFYSKLHIWNTLLGQFHNIWIQLFDRVRQIRNTIFELFCFEMKGFGGTLTFDLNKDLKVEKFLNSLKIIKSSMSLAGVESTALSPKLTSHALLSDFERKEQGINDQMIRFSTGIEFIDDLKNDLLQAVKKSL